MIYYTVISIIILLVLVLLWPALLVTGRRIKNYFKQTYRTLKGGAIPSKDTTQPRIKIAKTKRTKKSTVKKRK